MDTTTVHLSISSLTDNSDFARTDQALSDIKDALVNAGIPTPRVVAGDRTIEIEFETLYLHKASRTLAALGLVPDQQVS